MTRQNCTCADTLSAEKLRDCMCRLECGIVDTKSYSADMMMPGCGNNVTCHIMPQPYFSRENRMVQQLTLRKTIFFVEKEGGDIT